MQTVVRSDELLAGIIKAGGPDPSGATTKSL